MRFTSRSMTRLIATINASPDKLKTIVTLTYPEYYPRDGKTIKRHLDNFLEIFRSGEWRSEYLWVLEFQKRGAPHFHVVTSIASISPAMRVAIAERWIAGIAGSAWLESAIFRNVGYSEKEGTEECWEEYRKTISKAYWFTHSPETIELIRERDGAAKYLAKYAVKEYQKIAPKDFNGIGRYWGCSTKMKLSNQEFERYELTEDQLRNYLAETGHKASDWDVLPKYLFNAGASDNE